MFIIRAGQTTDLPFIIDSWAQSYYSTMRPMKRDHFFPYMKTRILKILSRAEVRVACSETNPDTILGWSCIEGDTLHYCFIRGGKDGFRGLGMAKSLVGGGIVNYSHLTEKIRKAPDGWDYRPDLA